VPVPIPVIPPDPALRDDAVELRPWRRDAPAARAAEDDRMRRGDGLTLAVLERDGEMPRGHIGLQVLADDREVAEVAHDGVHAAAVRLLAAWALREWGLRRLQLATLVEDAASQDAAEEAGFRREGVLRSWSELDGRRVDMVMFSLLPGDL
jgi:[ribosomal protein S5]-alanine N-acetyltransferase